jgi:hypothetical protein
MAEDSGAFKTNPAIRAQFWLFVRTRQAPLQLHSTAPAGVFAPPIFNERADTVAVLWNKPDSRRGVSAASRTWPVWWSPRSRRLKRLCENPAKVELASMLPGFRFLFAAIMLSMSVLIFGLGAAALLRVAHDEFTSNPSWRGAPEVMFAQQSEATRPVLAMLRVDTPAAEEKAQDDAPMIAAPTEQTAITPAPAESERIAARKPEAPAPAETAKGETARAVIPIAENPVAGDAAPALRAVPAGETRVAMIAPSEALLRENDAIPAQSEPMGAQVAPIANIAARKIATLGGPSVNIETTRPAKVRDVKPDQSEVKKRQQARRAAQRRRIAARARVAAQAAALPANPFGQPAPAVRSR